jgi:hypothetical protein
MPNLMLKLARPHPLNIQNTLDGAVNSFVINVCEPFFPTLYAADIRSSTKKQLQPQVKAYLMVLLAASAPSSH